MTNRNKQNGTSLIEVFILIAIFLILLSLFVSASNSHQTVCKQGVEYFKDRYGYPASPVIDATTKEPKLCFEKE